MNGDSRGTLGGQGQRDGGSSLQSLSYLREAELQEAANPSSQLQRGRGPASQAKCPLYCLS